MAAGAESVIEEAERLLKAEPGAELELAVQKLREDLVEPVARLRRVDNPELAEGARSLCVALEEYVRRPAAYPPARCEQKTAVTRGCHRLRGAAQAKPKEKPEPEPEPEPKAEEEPEVTGKSDAPLSRLRDLPWRTVLDAEGRIAFDAGAGAVVPLHGDITELARPWVIEQTFSATPPDPPEMRPLDVRKRPGSLLRLESGERLIVVGDLHGRFASLETILKDKDNWSAIKAGQAHLVFTGDAIHPRHSKDPREAYEDSFRVMFLIMTLRAENLGNVHYLVGNHENAHVGGFGAGREDTRVDEEYEQLIAEKFGRPVLDRYEEFMENAPVAAKARVGDDYVILVHAGLSSRIRSERGLVNVLVPGRKSPVLNDLLWARDIDPERVRECLVRAGARIVISGHTRPRQETAEKYGVTIIADLVFGHVGHRQLLVCSQGSTFGYLNLDMRRPLPADLTDLKAPDGRPAFRVFRAVKNA